MLTAVSIVVTADWISATREAFAPVVVPESAALTNCVDARSTEPFDADEAVT